MSIYKCTRCPFTTVSHWLLREHELNRHVNDIKIDPKNPKAPTTVSFGPDVAKAESTKRVNLPGSKSVKYEPSSQMRYTLVHNQANLDQILVHFE